MKYIIVRNSSTGGAVDAISHLVEQVNERIKEGYRPYGDLRSTEYSVFQAMVKEDDILDDGDELGLR